MNCVRTGKKNGGGAGRPPLVLVPQYFGSVVFDRRTSRYLPFDEGATALLKRLAEEQVDAVIGGESDEARREEMIGFYRAFYERGFFSLDGRFAGEVREVEPAGDHLTGPLALHLEVSAACNLTCRHCFAGELPRKERALTLEELDALFGQMAELGTFRLGLTGGEPLLRKDLFEIIDLALEHGLCPCVTTNGLLMTEEIAKKFGRRELVWLNVSLEGATAGTNDAVRGEGVFERVMERVAILRKHSRFTMAFTVLSSNVDEIEACAALAEAAGASTAVFRPLYPVGVARHHLELMPTYEQYNGALGRLSGLEAEGAVTLRHLEPFGPGSRREGQSVIFQNYGCGAGNLVCSVSVSGDVSPCSFLGPESYTANVRERSLKEIWDEGRGFREIRGLPDAEPGDEAVFSGGCRARALVLNGSMNAPDPWIGAKEALAQLKGGGVYHPMEVVHLTVKGRR